MSGTTEAIKHGAQYVYAIYTPTQTKSKKSVIEFGITCNIMNCFVSYPKHCTVVYLHKVKNNKIVKDRVLASLKEHFEQITINGKEYFSGESMKIINQIDQIITIMHQKVDDDYKPIINFYKDCFDVKISSNDEFDNYIDRECGEKCSALDSFVVLPKIDFATDNKVLFLNDMSTHDDGIILKMIDDIIDVTEFKQSATNVCRVDVTKSNQKDKKTCEKCGKKFSVPGFNYHVEKNVCEKVKTKCADKMCINYPVYNYKGNVKGLYCYLHKLEEMINVVVRCCNFEGTCTNRARFNFYGMSPILCGDHCVDGMINVTTKKCKHDFCTKAPLYNYEYLKSGIYCRDHKHDGMVCVHDRKICKVVGCKKQAYFAVDGSKHGDYCNKHKKKGMVNIHYTKCEQETCNTQVNPVTNVYGKYCFFCYMVNNPDANCGNVRAEEISVARHIRTKFGHIDISFNNKIRTGMSDRRPDVLFKLEDRYINIEIDENQHDGKQKDDKLRNKQIHNDLDGKPLLIIRFNPHKYIENNVSNKSCWGFDKHSNKYVCDVIGWETRLNNLDKVINEFIENTNPNVFEVIYLYYDKYEDD
jgi:hypothetical protein